MCWENKIVILSNPYLRLQITALKKTLNYLFDNHS
ncbi:MAG: hypothetical protein JWR23_1516 [Mucilaginibacter sp.]|nr:hypothetical protein [Mucilaginibacter sp.]